VCTQWRYKHDDEHVYENYSPRKPPDMPLTARLPNNSVLDATSCTAQQWASVYKVTPRADMSCRGCNNKMHAKISKAGATFFAHDSKSPHCPSNGETQRHRELKALISDLIRTAGGTAIIEATPEPGDQGGWRADVLAIGPDGTRTAFEVQLASMTLEDGQARTARYAADNIAVVWVTDKDPHWLYKIPSISIRIDAGTVTVPDGVAHYNEKRACRWTVVDGSFSTLVSAWLANQLQPLVVPALNRGNSTSRMYSHGATVFAPVEMIQDWNIAQKEDNANDDGEADEGAAKFGRSTPHKNNLLELESRQERVTSKVLDYLCSKYPPAQVWVGAMRLSRDELAFGLWDTVGDDTTGYGRPVWIGQNSYTARLHAVVCPVATKLSASIGAKWLADRVFVVVETESEAIRVAKSLGWAATKLVVANSHPHLSSTSAAGVAAHSQ